MVTAGTVAVVAGLAAGLADNPVLSTEDVPTWGLATGVAVVAGGVPVRGGFSVCSGGGGGASSQGTLLSSWLATAAIVSDVLAGCPEFSSSSSGGVATSSAFSSSDSCCFWQAARQGDGVACASCLITMAVGGGGGVGGMDGGTTVNTSSLTATTSELRDQRRGVLWGVHMALLTDGGGVGGTGCIRSTRGGVVAPAGGIGSVFTVKGSQLTSGGEGES